MHLSGVQGFSMRLCGEHILPIQILLRFLYLDDIVVYRLSFWRVSK
jgi:hypothetical protein